jgi:ABC-type Co2+ transport system permease subunit
MSAGVGDSFMAIFTNKLSKRINVLYSVIIGQISRYLFTSGMVALALGVTVSLDAIAIAWVAFIPSITASIVANAALSALVVVALKKFYPSLLNKPRKG